MAFSIASGLSPQAGIYCAIVTGFLISALGGSKTPDRRPTGAFVVVIAGIVAAHGVDGLFMCTVMAGVLLVAMGVTGMGSAIKGSRSTADAHILGGDIERPRVRDAADARCREGSRRRAGGVDRDAGAQLSSGFISIA